jgi:hypothetical protein
MKNDKTFKKSKASKDNKQASKKPRIPVELFVDGLFYAFFRAKHDYYLVMISENSLKRIN